MINFLRQQWIDSRSAAPDYHAYRTLSPRTDGCRNHARTVMLELSTATCLETPFENIANDLQQQGWSACDDLIAPAIVADLRQEALVQWQQGEFNPAGVGRGKDRIIDQTIRSDKVSWLTQEHTSPAQAIYWQTIEQLRATLNRRLYLGLVDFEAHLSVYLPGDRYRRHVDQFRGASLREVSVILYLNDDWQPASGGELLLYSDRQSRTPLQRFYPAAGKLVVFMSADFPHEVLPATRQRLSMTGWYKKRDLLTAL